MTVKMIFSDIDGTLLTSHHRISRGTREAIQDCSKKQIPFILVSARMPGGIIPLQAELNIPDPIVCYGGALVYRKPVPGALDCPMLNIYMDPKLVFNIHSTICKRFPDICFSAYSLNEWLVPEPDNRWIVQEEAITGTPARPFKFSSSEGNMSRINKTLCMGAPAAIDSLNDYLKKENTPASIYKSKPTYLEITDQKANKAAALELLINHFHIDRDETIAFGDNFNDLEMLRFAGTGFAMGNAPDAVKSSADFITDSNDQDGIAKALKKLGIL
ncbi:Cof-type HAD-IIB family hydrolase [Sporolactobacillus pectinivorans]|uniref:Cof-type HAD-IIB family hydrolase n=1 Tax=Sporolactobacillus pectinivorans TaxID=1591408 RepID=UPI000C269B30|nr:Cof-type HAD-IIB family hydrolase [Sporolactobacillus pectinivorans]